MSSSPAAARAEPSPSRRKASVAVGSWSALRWTSARRKIRCRQTAISASPSWTPTIDLDLRKLIPCKRRIEMRRKGMKCQSAIKILVLSFCLRWTESLPFLILTANRCQPLGARRESFIEGNKVCTTMPGIEWMGNKSAVKLYRCFFMSRVGIKLGQWSATHSSGSNSELNTIFTFVCTDDVVMW